MHKFRRLLKARYTKHFPIHTYSHSLVRLQRTEAGKKNHRKSDHYYYCCWILYVRSDIESTIHFNWNDNHTHTNYYTLHHQKSEFFSWLKKIGSYSHHERRYMRQTHITSWHTKKNRVLFEQIQYNRRKNIDCKYLHCVTITTTYMYSFIDRNYQKPTMYIESRGKMHSDAHEWLWLPNELCILFCQSKPDADWSLICSLCTKRSTICRKILFLAKLDFH
jgi:hypothetical protein